VDVLAKSADRSDDEFVIIPSVHALDMCNTTPPESSGVPLEIRDAEEWRVLGERLRSRSSSMFRALFVMLVMSIGPETPNDDAEISKSYLVT
jgi:hypothetical protein